LQAAVNRHIRWPEPVFMTKKNQSIAIVGVGPRGLAALEALFLALQDATVSEIPKLLLFEASPHFGAGQIWSPAQVATNLSNIHERHLANGLAGRPEIRIDDLFIPAFASYREWINYPENHDPQEKDHFPSRSKIGAYLNARFESIACVLADAGLAECLQKAIVLVETTATGCMLTDAEGIEYEVAETVLTIGHQPVYDSDQLRNWEAHAREQKLMLYKDPYPVGALETEAITPGTVIAMRGFGLSMVDQMRALTLGFGGSFTEIPDTDRFQYSASEQEPRTLIAFSLDGLPPAPKPKNAKIDAWFEPSAESMLHFKTQIEEANQHPDQIKDASFLIEALGEMTASVYLDLKTKARPTTLDRHELAKLTESLLRQPKKLQHELLLSHDIPAIEALNALLDMACGREKISLDYCLGQVWRYALGVLYHEFTHFDFGDAAMIDLVKYIEASKRYSYGPPIASVQQLIALVEAEVLHLDFVDNPQIEEVVSGWKLHKNGKSVTADVMVNSVVDPPQLLKVSSPLIQNLIADKKVSPVNYKLGLHTLEDGRIISKAGNTHQPIALLGRLAKGSVIGVDDLIECFGKPANKWAAGVLSRMRD